MRSPDFFNGRVAFDGFASLDDTAALNAPWVLAETQP